MVEKGTRFIAIAGVWLLVLCAVATVTANERYEPIQGFRLTVPYGLTAESTPSDVAFHPVTAPGGRFLEADSLWSLDRLDPDWIRAHSDGARIEPAPMDTRIVAAAAADRVVLVLDDGNDTADEFFGFANGISVFQWGNAFYLDRFDFQLESIRFIARSENQDPFVLSAAVFNQHGDMVAQGIDLSLPPGPTGAWYELDISEPIDFRMGEVFFLICATGPEIETPAGIDHDAATSGQSFYVDPASDRYVYLREGSGYPDAAFVIRAVGTLTVPENLPPEAIAQIDPHEVEVGEPVTFDATNSTDEDGQVIKYLWDFGDTYASSDAQTTHAYASPTWTQVPP